MAEGTELAKAYVQVLPTTKNLKSNLTNEFTGAGEAAGEAGGKASGSSWLNAFKVIAVAGAAALGAVIGKSLSEGMQLEQSIGGIETMFGESSDKMMDYANKAYDTAGLSANAYMQQVTSFSARLLQGLGGDTEAAADIANMAMVDMADNANKFGTDIASIQNAYQGLAKANFTMLDNLKLGYGGTAAEMARLINDSGVLNGEFEATAQNVKDIPFDTMIDAIHQVQTEMGVTGTTALEAAETMSGSLYAMKAAAQNVLGNLALGEDIKPSLSALKDTVISFGKNIVPAIMNIVTELPSGLSDILVSLTPELAAQGIVMITTLAQGLATSTPALVGAGLEAVGAVAAGIVSALPTLLPAVTDMALGIAQQLVASLPIFLATASDLMMSLVSALPKMAQSLATQIPIIVQNLSQTLVAQLPILLAAASQLLMAIVRAVAIIAPDLLRAAVRLVSEMASLLPSLVGILLESAVSLLMAIVDALPVILPVALQGIVDLVVSLATMLPTLIDKIFEGALQLLMGIVEAVPVLISVLAPEIPKIIQSIISLLVSALPKIVQGAYQMLLGIIDAIPKLLPVLFREIPNIVRSIVEALVEGIPQILQAGVEIFGSITDALPQVWNSLVSVGTDLVKGIWNGISDATGWILSKIRGFGTAVLNGIKSIFGIKSPSKETAWMGEMLDAGLAEGIEDNTRPITKAIDEVARLTTGGLESELRASASVGITAADTEGGALADIIVAIAALGDRIAGMQLVLDGKKLVGGIAPRVDNALGGLSAAALRGLPV